MTRHPSDRRLPFLDSARGIALIAMAIYHFVWDLELFGWIEPGTALTAPWKPFARSIAFSFLFLVGISLVLAAQGGIDWRRYLARLARISAAAALITVATWFAMPEGLIFFGILHHIALASVLGLAFLRLPAWLLAALAAALWSGQWYMSGIIDIPALAFLGLNATTVRSNDFVPLVPWFGAVLAGMAAGRISVAHGWLTWLADVPAPRPLAWLGRHSLAFYLIHQPVLIGLIYAATAVARG